MRLWPWSRRPALAPASIDLLCVENVLRQGLDDVFAVRERQVLGGVIVYRGRLLVPASRAVDLLQASFRPFGFTPFLRAEGGEVVLQALPLVESTERPRVAVNVVLFVLTCISMLLAGTLFAGSPTFDALRGTSIAGFIASGVPFAATLMAILGVHEFGHYFTARHHRASVSLPYFIPAPPPLFLFGTLGAIIRMRSPARDRNALFDIAVAGPLAGLAVALPAMILGLEWSRLVPARPDLLLFGDSLLLRFLVTLRFGDIPAGMVLFTHPMADAAWTGFLVTALNLFPVGQLDGGRIAYALFGRRHRLVGLATFAALLLLGAVTRALNWFVWAALLFFLVGFHHSPPLDDVTPLTPGRRLVGLLCLVALVLLLPPVPISLE
jgi:membrane-associated protease RseP (regulator of RpoE activity)